MTATKYIPPLLLVGLATEAASWTTGFVTSSVFAGGRPTTRTGSRLSMNIFSDIGDMMTGGKLVPQTSLPYGSPLCGSTSISSEPRTFVIQERALSFTGEDFDVCDENGNSCMRVRGAMMHLPGKDKMRIYTGDEVAVLDRKLVSMTPTYDLYRGGMGAEKIGWIEKVAVSLTESFNVYMEGKGGIGPFKPPPAYKLEGDFLERNFCMKNEKGEVVAKVAKDGIIQFDAFNHYQVQVAPGMDAVLVLSCACAIDEEFDEEHQEWRKKEEEEGRGWFG